MRTLRLWLSALLGCSAIGMAPWPAAAQQGGFNPNRDCQTFVTCRYTGGGVYRGCLSSYSCRICRMVPARCSIGPGSRVCQRMQCTWG
jgi:hypothetical protein